MISPFHEPQRQSLLGIVVMYGLSLKQMVRAFLPVIIALYIGKTIQKPVFVASIVTALALLLLVYAWLSFKNFTFYIDAIKREFIIQSGVFSKKKISIQLHKIQNVSINQTWLQRILNVYEVTVETAGTDKKEGVIHAVSNQLAQALKEELLIKEQRIEGEEIAEDESKKIVLKISPMSLLKVGLTSRYFETMSILFVFFLTLTDELNTIGYLDFFEIEENTFSSILSMLTVFVGMMIVLVFVYNLVRTMLRFYDFTIYKDKNALLLSFGLLNTYSTIVKSEKVQLIKITRNYFQKKLNISEVRIIQAQESKEKSKSKLQIPGCNDEELAYIQKQFFSEVPQKGVMLKPNWRRAGFDLFFTMVLPALGLFGISYFWLKELSFALAILLLFSIIRTVFIYFNFKNYRIFLDEKFIIKTYGAWDVTTVIMPIDKIQALSNSQLFWYKPLGLGTIKFCNAGENITFYTGDFEQIQQWTNYYLYSIESRNKNWM